MIHVTPENTIECVCGGNLLCIISIIIHRLTFEIGMLEHVYQIGLKMTQCAHMFYLLIRFKKFISQVTDTNGPAMTWAIFCICALRLNVSCGSGGLLLRAQLPIAIIESHSILLLHSTERHESSSGAF